jgi:hypothetical protein
VRKFRCWLFGHTIPFWMDYKIPGSQIKALALRCHRCLRLCSPIRLRPHPEDLVFRGLVKLEKYDGAWIDPE